MRKFRIFLYSLAATMNFVCLARFDETVTMKVVHAIVGTLMTALWANEVRLSLRDEK